jgi:hypothetical protein
LDRARKIAKRLHDRWGGVTEEEYEFPPKPPRMRWATYNRLEAAERHGLEGIVSKRQASAYRSGPSRDWLKVKTAAWREANRERWRMFEKR